MISAREQICEPVALFDEMWGTKFNEMGVIFDTNAFKKILGYNLNSRSRKWIDLPSLAQTMTIIAFYLH